jgi:hypothetical protein
MVNLARRESREGLEFGVGSVVSARIFLRELSERFLGLCERLGLGLVCLVCLSRNGGFMVYFTGVRRSCWLCFVETWQTEYSG